MGGPVGVLPERSARSTFPAPFRRRCRPPGAARRPPARPAAWFRRGGCLSVRARRRRFRRAGRRGSWRRRRGSFRFWIRWSLVVDPVVGVERLALDPDREDAEEGEDRAEDDKPFDRASSPAAHRGDGIRGLMKLEGIHHITAITEDAQRNVDFYAGVLGLRLVKKTVNQDNPTVYHLFYADEAGAPGSDLTFFEYPGVRAGPGRRGDGPPDRLAGRLAGESLDFWDERLAAAGVEPRRAPATASTSPTPRGSTTSCVVGRRRPTRRWSPTIPRSRRSWRCRASTPCAPTATAPEPSSGLLEALEFERGRRRRWEARGDERGGRYLYDQPPTERGLQGAGTRPPRRLGLELRGAQEWRQKAISAGAHPTPVDRPLLLPLDLLPRAERRPLRDRDAWGRASPSTSRSSTSARSSRCRPTTSTCGPRSSRTCARSINPRAIRSRVNGDFIWRDAGRAVVFRHERARAGAAAPRASTASTASSCCSTPRALSGVGELAAAATAVHEVAPGQRARARPPLLDSARSSRDPWSRSAAAASSTSPRRSPRSAAPASRRSRRRCRGPR